MESGGHPYVVRTSQNNGIKGYLNASEEFLNAGNTLSFGQDTATIYYQEKPYFTGDKIKVLYPLDEKFSKKNAQFFVASLSQSFSSFSWGGGSFSASVIEDQVLKLPIESGSSNKIDYSFIESFLAELEAAHLAELEAYLQAAGLEDYVLTDEEAQALEKFERLSWELVKVPDIFNVKNTGNILSRDVVNDSGEIAYLGAGAQNNSVISYVDYELDKVEAGNCVFIGGKTFVVTYQKDKFFSNDSHNLALYYKGESLGESAHLFFVTALRKGLSHLYSWGDSVSSRKIRKDSIMHPVFGGGIKLDKKFIDHLITAVQKLVIRDVVDYAKSKSDAMRQAVEG